MTDKRVRIAVSDLPPRARQPTDSQLEKVFGGACTGRRCYDNRNCCTGYYCYNGACVQG